jgi:hypothetical protein
MKPIKETNLFVYVLRIFCDLINEEDTLIMVTETKNLAIEIALVKLIENKAFIYEYTRYCGKRAEEFPTLPPLSYNDWLADAIAKDELNGGTITPRPLITYDNVGDLVL